MEIKWTQKALSDLVRLHDFLASVDSDAAAKVIRSLASAPVTLLQYPRLGEKLDEFENREVRRLQVGRYEMRYEIRGSIIYILRLWHTREER